MWFQSDHQYVCYITRTLCLDVYGPALCVCVCVCVCYCRAAGGRTDSLHRIVQRAMGGTGVFMGGRGKEKGIGFPVHPPPLPERS